MNAMCSPEYIDACELDSPNSPDFPTVLKSMQIKSLEKAKRHLRAKAHELWTTEAIGDEVFCAIVDAIGEMSI